MTAEALLRDDLIHNRCASTQGHNKGPCGRGWGENDCYEISWETVLPAYLCVVKLTL